MRKFIRKKETKPRDLKPNCGRKQFLDKFGKPIEEYESFKRATEGLNWSTQKTYRRTLPAYFLFLGEDPDTVINNRKKDLTDFDVTLNERYERKTKAYVKLLVSRNISVVGHLGRIQGFFSNNSHRLSLDLKKLKYPKARKTRKYSPCNDDVRKLFAVADCARDKLIVALMYEHGPAPVDVAALNIGDYPLEPWSYFELSRSKTGEVWRGISTPDVCECLRNYLVIRKGIVGEPLFFSREGLLNNAGVSVVVSSLIKKCGLSGIAGFKPTSLRDGFEDNLADAEIYHKTKEALMGHTVDIEHDYGGFDKMVKRLTEAMKKVYPLICLSNSVFDVGLAGLSAADLESVRELAADVAMYRELRDLFKAGKLVHVDDPELNKKLKEKGKIS
jgi:integrase